MITVKTKELGKPSDLVKNIKSIATNELAKAIAKQLSERLKNVKCNNHPSSNPIIMIRADDNGKCTVLKENFCCTEFKNSIDITV